MYIFFPKKMFRNLSLLFVARTHMQIMTALKLFKR